jgi:Domain of unknown function (DUF4279)
MTAPAKAPAHQYSVALRFTGDDLDPNAVSEKLQLQPAQAWRKGEDARPRSVTGGWEFRLEPDNARFWSSMDSGLNALMDTLTPFRREIRELALRYHAMWWIGHFQTSLDGGPALSSTTQERLSAFGIALSIDNYFSQGEDDGD